MTEVPSEVIKSRSCFTGYEHENQVVPRENEGTEREAQGVGRDMSCPRKLYLDERKSLF